MKFSILSYGLGIFCPIRMSDKDPKPSSINGIQVWFHDALRLLCNARRQQHATGSEKTVFNSRVWNFGTLLHQKLLRQIQNRKHVQQSENMSKRQYQSEDKKSQSQFTKMSSILFLTVIYLNDKILDNFYNLIILQTFLQCKKNLYES